MSVLGNVARARAELEAHNEDPWHKSVKAAVRDKDAISTAALLDLLHVQATTGTARRLAAVMRALQFHSNQIEAPHAGRPSRKHGYTRLGPYRSRNEVVPNDACSATILMRRARQSG